MITNDQQQAAWISYLKSIPATISPVTTDEVREESWKGDKFVYPNIRVRPISVIPHRNPACHQTTGRVTITVFSEQKSSKEADDIAGNISNYLHGRKFTSGGVSFWETTVEVLNAAIPEGDLIWRSEIQLKSLMS